MDGPAREQVQPQRPSEPGRVRRRHVIYVEGYDPRGAEAYYQLFRRECERFQREWPVRLTLYPLELESHDFARWRLDAQNANWQVATCYDFVRLERLIGTDIAGPMPLHVLRGLAWIAEDLLNSTQLRIFRASWRFGLHLLGIQLLLLAGLALSVAIAIGVGYAALLGLGLPAPIDIADAIAAGFVVLLLLHPIAKRWFVIQITNCWVTLRRFARGRATWIDQVVEAGARRLVAAAAARDADELVLVGHSTGSVIASAIMVRALELDPDLGRKGPRLVLLTLGSVMPAVALDRAAGKTREMVRRLAVEPTLAWVDCRSRKDIMNFPYLDPVAGIGVEVGPERCNPLIWMIRFKDMVSSEAYRRLRWSFFRLHFQFIMASERPSPYDYILLVSGPAAIPEWAARHDELSFAFIRNGALPGAAHQNADAAAAARRP